MKFAPVSQSSLSIPLFLLCGMNEQAKVVDVPIFSFYMGNIDTDSPTGFLTLGGVNQTHYEGEAGATNW